MVVQLYAYQRTFDVWGECRGDSRKRIWATCFHDSCSTDAHWDFIPVSCLAHLASSWRVPCAH